VALHEFSAPPSAGVEPAGGAAASTAPSGAAFGEKLLQLLDEGQFTATYKFAVLLGLTELCLEHDAAPSASLALTTARSRRRSSTSTGRRPLLRWPQRDETLVQNRGGQAEIVSAICRFRERFGGDPGEPLWRARTCVPERYERLVRRVEWKLIEMPLPRLQVVGNTENRFLYEIGWDTRVRRQDVEIEGFDGHIHLLPGVADNLIRFSGLLRPLIQRAWAGMVAGINRDATDEARLQEFLFGASRVASIRFATSEAASEQPLLLCDKRMHGPVDIDHFIPGRVMPTTAFGTWSRPTSSATTETRFPRRR
jgi:hypothetical protein